MPTTKTVRFAAVIAGTATLALVVGVGSGLLAASGTTSAGVESPAPLTVEVSQGPLTSSFVFRGTIGRVSTSAISDLADEGQIVTRVPVTAGQQVAEGDVLLEVAERPTMMLVGVMPMYRNLAPGDSGQDVGQLNDALRRMGMSSPNSSSFTAQTSAAIRGLYARAGYPPPRPSAAAADALRQAKDVLAAARSAAASGASSVSVANAVRALERAKRALQIARSAAILSKATADSEVDGATAVRTRATQAFDLAASRAATAEAGTDPDTGGPVSPSRLAELYAVVASASDEVNAAEAALALSVLSKSTVYLSADSSIQDATDEVSSAKESLADARAIVGRDAGLAAETARAVKDAQTEETEAALAADTPLPRSEAIFIREPSPTITSVAAEVGKLADGELLVIGVDELQVVASVPAADLARVAPGDEVKIDVADKSVSAIGSIISIDEAGTTSTGGQVSHEVIVALDGSQLDESVIGKNVRVVRETTSGSPSTYSVPTTAVRSSLAGATFIDVIRDSQMIPVPVVVGISVQGQVEITTVDPFDLAGAQVVLHWNSPGDADDGD